MIKSAEALELRRRARRLRRQAKGMKRDPYVRPVQIDAAAAAERDRRLSTVPTIYHLIFGDPLPGQSALDRR